MNRVICLLLTLCCVFYLCACGESALTNNKSSPQKTFDFGMLSKNTTYDEITAMLGDNHSERENESRAIRGEVYHIKFPKGTVLSGLVASSEVDFEFFQSTNTLSEVHFDFIWEGENVDAFYVVKESLDKVYGEAKESGKQDGPFAPDRTFRWREHTPEVFCIVWIGEDSRLTLQF